MQAASAAAVVQAYFDTLSNSSLFTFVEVLEALIRENLTPESTPSGVEFPVTAAVAPYLNAINPKFFRHHPFPSSITLQYALAILQLALATSASRV